MTQSIKISVAQQGTTADIQAVWAQVPHHVQGLLGTLKEVNLVQEKPSLEALLTLHDCRLLWQGNEVTFRRVQRPTLQGLRHHYHAIVCDETMGFQPQSANFKTFTAQIHKPSNLYISRYFQATQGQKINPADLKTAYQIQTRLLKVEDTFYEQWLRIKEEPKEAVA